MSGYILYFCRWHMWAATVAKLVSFSILLTCAVQQQVWSQVPSLGETVKLYEQAASQKEYTKASQYAYEIATYYQHARDAGKSLDYFNLSLAHAKKSGDQTKVYSILHHLGLHYMDIKKFSKALENFQSALTIVQKLNNGVLIREELMNVSISYDKL
ncbi:MAG TPA: tetratricopeptide repeat protein, partial [Chryseolinea sp.]|nr:tetratricopeptide repeat protein [Chryseolinea sp.]